MAEDRIIMASAGSSAPASATAASSVPQQSDGEGRQGRKTLWVPGRLPRPPAERRSWLQVGFGLGVGLLLAYALAEAILRSAQVLTLVLLALFIAISLEPMVVTLMKLRLRRGLAVTVVLVGFATMLGVFVALVIPPVSNEITALSKAIPVWLQELHDHHSRLGQLEDRYHLVDKAKTQFSSGNVGSTVASGVLGAGRMILGVLSGFLIVTTLTIYFLIGMPAIRDFGLRFVASERRDGVEHLADKILLQVGRYMLGNLATSVLAGAATWIWCWAAGVPYAAMLGFFVAIMDLVPMVGSLVGGIVVSLVALSVSMPVAIATCLFYTFFRFMEDHLIMPLTMKYTVRMHPVATMIAVLLGGTLLGIIGALVAVPAATAIGLILDDVVFPKKEA